MNWILVSVSWVAILFSIGAGAIYFLLARKYLRQSARGARGAAVLVFGLSLFFRWIHAVLSRLFDEPWPLDLSDEHTAFLLFVPLLSAGTAMCTSKTSLKQAAIVAVVAFMLNTGVFLALGFVFFAFH
ncbi:MAG: hypothetical protein ACRD5G_04885 [Candidatus Acidiferrales bacterium]